jgi:hypothetical protein
MEESQNPMRKVCNATHPTVPSDPLFASKVAAELADARYISDIVTEAGNLFYSRPVTASRRDCNVVRCTLADFKLFTCHPSDRRWSEKH